MAKNGLTIKELQESFIHFGVLNPYEYKVVARVDNKRFDIKRVCYDPLTFELVLECVERGDNNDH